MSLATRCAACGTVFRVVQDQLKVSEGWVRCGRCGDVFNALEGLFDLDRETAPAWTPSQRGALDLLPPTDDEHAAQTADGADLAAQYAESVEIEAKGGSEASADTEIDTRADSQVDTQDAERDALDEDAVGRGEISEFDFEEDADEPEIAADISAEPRPAFLRQAERAAFWQHPGVRLSLATLATVLGLLLVAQATLWNRDLIAARWPQAMPLLVKLCEPLDCRIESLRRLDGLAVESSGLTQLDSPSLYRLQVALRNRDAHPLLTPALDVTLTDSRGEIVSRRVFSRRDFGTAVPATMGAGAELALQVVLDSGERSISGYSIEIFYP
jgi:predicted Zn finger-like uncharacterized protein